MTDDEILMRLREVMQGFIMRLDALEREIEEAKAAFAKADELPEPQRQEAQTTALKQLNGACWDYRELIKQAEQLGHAEERRGPYSN